MAMEETVFEQDEYLCESILRSTSRSSYFYSCKKLHEWLHEKEKFKTRVSLDDRTFEDS